MTSALLEVENAVLIPERGDVAGQNVAIEYSWVKRRAGPCGPDERLYYANGFEFQAMPIDNCETGLPQGGCPWRPKTSI